MKNFCSLLLMSFVLGGAACGQDIHKPESTVATQDTDYGPHIQYIAHASFRFEAEDGSSVVIDPFNSRIWLGYKFPPNIEADALLISHPHFDHDAVNHFPSSIPAYRKADVHTVGSITVRGIKSEHSFADSIRKRGLSGDNILWVIEYDGKRIVHFGDNREITDAEAKTVRALGPIDVAIGLASQGVEKIGAKHVVPMHYRYPKVAPDGGAGMQTLDEIIGDRKDVTRLRGNILKWDEFESSQPLIAFQPIWALGYHKPFYLYSDEQVAAQAELDKANAAQREKPANLSKAEEHYVQAIEADPTWIQPYIALARNLEDQSRPAAEIIEVLGTGLNNSKDMALSQIYRTMHMLARNYNESDNSKDAEFYYKEILKMSKDYGIAAHEEAEVFLKEQKTSKASR